jgi:hypothetical protein
MQGPFRYQAAAGDCFTTSMVNGLVALYPFYDIPSFVVQRIYQYTLDDNSQGGGTSDEAGRFLAHWLSTLDRGKFKLSAEFLEGADVRLKPGGRILRHLGRGGVAAFDIHTTGGARHSILALHFDREWLYGWDPRYRTRAIRAASAAQVLHPASPDKPNLRVRRAWLERTSLGPFTLGPLANRCAILLARP